jgi:hypothetical protein
MAKVWTLLSDNLVGGQVNGRGQLITLPHPFTTVGWGGGGASDYPFEVHKQAPSRPSKSSPGHLRTDVPTAHSVRRTFCKTDALLTVIKYF